MVDRKKRRDKTKSTLSNAQEVSYARDFKMADQAGGFTSKQAHH
ncbi:MULTISPECIES: YfhE family protein [Bacillaceae]|nr:MULTISPECIES: YfhE family protein [Bacillaceae]MDX8362360.1 YfhE family protein [Cytobacillus sp. IB215316]MDX8367275.1 YfhE family protein [Cytobacillus sp. IB215665]